jgi:hypothetical protein
LGVTSIVVVFLARQKEPLYPLPKSKRRSKEMNMKYTIHHGNESFTVEGKSIEEIAVSTTKEIQNRVWRALDCWTEKAFEEK